MTAATLNTINARLKKHDLEVVKGDGYFYFMGLSDNGQGTADLIPSVYSMTLRTMTLEEWVAYAEEAIERNAPTALGLSDLSTFEADLLVGLAKGRLEAIQRREVARGERPVGASKSVLKEWDGEGADLRAQRAALRVAINKLGGL